MARFVELIFVVSMVGRVWEVVPSGLSACGVQMREVTNSAPRIGLAVLSDRGDHDRPQAAAAEDGVDEVLRDDAAETRDGDLPDLLGQPGLPLREPLEDDRLGALPVVVDGDVRAEERAVQPRHAAGGGDENLRRGSSELSVGGRRCEEEKRNEAELVHAMRHSKLSAVVAFWL